MKSYEIHQWPSGVGGLIRVQPVRRAGGLLQYELLTERHSSAFYTRYATTHFSAHHRLTDGVLLPVSVTSESVVHLQSANESDTRTLTNRTSA